MGVGKEPDLGAGCCRQGSPPPPSPPLARLQPWLDWALPSAQLVAMQVRSIALPRLQRVAEQGKGGVCQWSASGVFGMRTQRAKDPRQGLSVAKDQGFERTQREGTSRYPAACHTQEGKVPQLSCRWRKPLL